MGLLLLRFNGAPEYGNMVWLCAFLLDTAFEPDEMLSGDPCLKGCTLCIDYCPVHALGVSMRERHGLWAKNCGLKLKSSVALYLSDIDPQVHQKSGKFRAVYRT